MRVFGKVPLLILAIFALLALSGSTFAFDHTVRLLDVNGLPLADYEVWIWVWDQDADVWFYIPGQTDGNGEFVTDYNPDILEMPIWVSEAHDERFNSMNGSEMVWYWDGLSILQEEW